MASTTTYELYPLENFSGWWATNNALPDMSPGGLLGTTIKFGKNSSGQTIFEIIDPDVQHWSRKYPLNPNYPNSGLRYDFNNPLVNPQTGGLEWPSFYPDGVPVTNKTYLERSQFFKIADNGRSLVSTLPPGYRTVQGYGSNTTFKITGSGVNEICTSTGGNEFVSGSFQTPLFGVADVPQLPGQSLSQSYTNYLYAFSQYATGVQQRIKSYTVTESGILQDIAGTIAKLGPLAPIALNIAMPGVGAAISGALGIGSAAAGAAIGNALLATALNGGDLSAGLKAGLASYAGASLGGLAGELAKGGEFGSFLSNNPAMLTGLVNNVTQAAIKGQDVQTALAGSLLSAGISAATSQIEGFKDMPSSVQSTITSGISQALQGKDINVAGLISGAAVNAMVSYGLTQIPGYDGLDQKYKNLAATSLTAALQGKDLTKNAINWALSQASAAVAKGVADDNAKAAGWKNSEEKANAETVGVSTPEEYKKYEQNEKDKEDGWTGTEEKLEAEKEGFTDADSYHENEQAKEEGWNGTDEKDAAREAGFDNPDEYRQELVDQSNGWASTQEKLDAEEVGSTTPDEWKEYKADKAAEELGWADREQKDAAADIGIYTPKDYQYHLDDQAAKEEGWQDLISKNQAAAENISDPVVWKEVLDDRDAQSKGWVDSEERDAALALDFKTPESYKYYVDDQQAKSEGWDNIEEKQLADKENIVNVVEWKELVADRDAVSQGWADREERDLAKELNIYEPKSYKYYLDDEQAKSEGWTNYIEKEQALSQNFSDPTVYHQYVRDEDAKSKGFDDEADLLDAQQNGFDNPNEWDNHQEEQRIIEFYQEKMNRDPTPEELQSMKSYIGDEEHPEDFGDEKLIDLIRQNIDTTDYVYGPDGTRYDNEEDAIANNVFDFTDSWEGPVYGSDGNRYESAEDAIANGVFDFSGVKPDDFVEPEETEDEGTTGETVYEGQVITPDGTVYDSVADALADGQFNFSQYTPPEDEGQTDEPINLEEDEEEVQPETSGPVWGPDGTEYASAEEAMAEGVFNYLLSPPEEQPEVPEHPEEPDVPGPEEPDTGPELPPVDEEEPAPEEPILWEEDEEEPGPEEPILWEEDEEEPAPEPVTCEPGFHDDGTGLCVPDEESDTQDEPVDCGVGFHLNEDGVCESDDLPEEAVCEPGFHDDGTGLCVPDDDEEETDCGVGFHLNADGVCESDDATSGGGTGGGGTSGGTSSVRTRILQGLAKKALAAPAFQQQVQAPLAAAAETPEVLQQKSPLEQLGGKSIYPKRFRSVLQDYLEQIEPPEEFYSPAEGIEAPAPSQVLEQPSTFEQYREPDMATSTYFNYGQPQDLTELARMQQEQDLPLGEGLALPTGMAAGGMAAPLLMAKGGTGHGKNAHGALSIVEHSGKHRIDYRQGDAVTGAGDGQSDDIPAMLADGEFVIPADVVAALGNGSTKAGSDKLYEMMHSIRAHHRKAKPKDLPPPAKKSPLDYLKKGK